MREYGSFREQAFDRLFPARANEDRTQKQLRIMNDPKLFGLDTYLLDAYL